MVEHISHNLSPMAMISKYIKDTTPGAKVVFIGPCTAKKPRFWTKKSSRTSIPSSRSRSFKPSLTARIWKSRPLPKAFSTMPPISDASLLVAEDSATQSNNLSKSKTSISTSKVALATASTSAASHSSKEQNLSDVNFIEGMACTGGCIGGAGCLTHGEKNKAEVDKYGREALEKTITDAVSLL